MQMAYRIIIDTNTMMLMTRDS